MQAPRVDSWIDEHLTACREAYPEAAWDGDRPTRNAWLRAFIQAKVGQAEARAALGRLRGQDVAIDSGQALLAAILAEVDVIRRKPEVMASDRGSAEAESRDCPYCQGGGMATAYHPSYAGEPVVEINGRRVAARVAAHCVCKLGAWMRSKTDAEMRSRIPDFRDCLEGRSAYQADDPTAPEAEEWLESIGWREFVERLANRMDVATKGGAR